MPLDPRAKRLLDTVALGARAGSGPVTAAERRRSFRALMALGGGPGPAMPVRDASVPGPAGPLPVRLYAPAEAPAPGLVFFHGGGLVAGDLDTHDALCRRLAAAAGCRVVAVDYRLAPEHPFPAAQEDAVAAVRAVAATTQEFGLDPGRLAVGGDSGGATLAAVAAGACRDAGEPRLRLLLLLCPVLDLATERPSRVAFGQGYLLDRATMARDLADALPEGVAPSDPRVSPLRAARVEGLPPTVIHTAEFDPLRDEGEAYAARLREAGVPVRHTCHPGLIHHFLALDRLIPAAGPALAGVGAEMREAMG